MPGTIEIVEEAPAFFGSRHSGLSPKKYSVSVDGTVASRTIGQPFAVDVEPGTHTVQVSIDRFRTNTVAVTVVDGGRHVVHITPKADSVATHFGLIGMLIGLALPGLCWRAELPQS